MSILITLIIGGIAGWIAGLLQKGQGFGIIGNIIIGLIGGLIGSFVFSILGIQSTGLIGNIVVSTIGATILLATISFFQR